MNFGFGSTSKIWIRNITNDEFYLLFKERFSEQATRQLCSRVFARVWGNYWKNWKTCQTKYRLDFQSESDFRMRFWKRQNCCAIGLLRFLIKIFKISLRRVLFTRCETTKNVWHSYRIRDDKWRCERKKDRNEDDRFYTNKKNINLLISNK